MLSRKTSGKTIFMLTMMRAMMIIIMLSMLVGAEKKIGYYTPKYCINNNFPALGEGRMWCGS